MYRIDTAASHFFCWGLETRRGFRIRSVVRRCRCDKREAVKEIHEQSIEILQNSDNILRIG